MKKIKFPLFFVLFIITGISVYKASDHYIHLMLLWNLFLAFIPFYITNQFRPKDLKRVYQVIFAFFWLLFLPNAFYLITDLVHIQTLQFAPYTQYLKITAYPVVPWLELSFIIFGVLTGVYFGCASIYEFAKIFKNQTSKIGFYLIISFLCALGVYIGRFLRFNSWDIIAPHHIINITLSSFTWFSIDFITIFTVLIFILVVFYHFFIAGIIKDVANNNI